MISEVPGVALPPPPAAAPRHPPAAVGTPAGRLRPGGRGWHLGLDAGEEPSCAATLGTKCQAGVPACGSAYGHLCVPSQVTRH